MISFRLMENADIPMFLDWINRPHVAEWWHEPPPLAEIEAWCSRIGHDSRRDFHYIAWRDDADPIGFIQSYSAVAGHEEGWWLNEHDPGVRGIDQFLADAQQLGRGLGTALIHSFTVKLFSDPSVLRIQCDPAPNNHRAIRCYEKAGFRAVREVVTPDGLALLMYCERPTS